jgi:hexosaminidase
MIASLLPAPRSVTVLPGTARLADGLALEAPTELRSVAHSFARGLEASTGWLIRHVDAGDKGSIRLLLARDERMPDSDESYVLRVDDGHVSVRGASPAGVFYGLVTLRQLLPHDLFRAATIGGGPRAPVNLGGIEVVDGPEFRWRGVLLDVARHFMPKSFVLRLIDLISVHKFNVLHLHLTDDQGWRVQIDRYPRLIEVGAWRRESQLGLQAGAFDGRPHGGWYSKDDLREIVAYAAERFVTVMPEIDMPGHMAAAIAAYPELGNLQPGLGNRPPEVMTAWGISEHVLNVEESTVAFCTGVLEEVLEIFPGPYVHVGGDECPTTEWEESPSARAVMQVHGFTSARQLQGRFTARIAGFLTERGRRLVGWEEILEGGAPPGAVVVSWQGDAAGIEAAALGHDVVMAPQEWCYLDWSYSTDPFEPLSIRSAISVEKIYSFCPVPAAVAAAGTRSRVLGAQCQLWTENVETPERAEYQYFPRLCAFSEVVWSPSEMERSYAEFEPRLAEHLHRLDAFGVNYRPLGGPTPGQARTWIPPA